MLKSYRFVLSTNSAHFTNSLWDHIILLSKTAKQWSFKWVYVTMSGSYGYRPCTQSTYIYSLYSLYSVWNVYWPYTWDYNTFDVQYIHNIYHILSGLGCQGFIAGCYWIPLCSNKLYSLSPGLMHGPPSYLKEFDNVYVSAVGTSFYSQCVPSNSVHLGFSASAFHWLSERWFICVLAL